MTDMSRIRNAMISVLPETTASFAEKVEERFVYLPSAHTKALRLSCHLVVGARGVGKSFWTNALADSLVRQQLAKELPELGNLEVYTGYSARANRQSYPERETFAQQLEAGFSAYDIWRAVVFRWLLTIINQQEKQDTQWYETIQWVKNNPEQLARIAESANDRLQQNAKTGLILFDALDLTSDNWQTMDIIAQALMRVVLWLKSFSHLTAKVFLRADQFGRNILNFPDASKLLATKVDLTWFANDLHGLLWQRLCNADGNNGEYLRNLYQQGVSAYLFGELIRIAKLNYEADSIWRVHEEFKRNAELQRKLFILLAGEWMGKGPRRGVPYVWTVSHLADGQGITSPRSFLIALRNAAEFSAEKHPNYEFALHYDGIKQGVQKASVARVEELDEDYIWLNSVMKPLEGVTLPCEFGVIETRWNAAFPSGFETISFNLQESKSNTNILSKLNTNILPPKSSENGWLGLRKELELIGVMKIKKDGRVDMPDLYRVGFKLGRRGGVKPNK